MAFPRLMASLYTAYPAFIKERINNDKLELADTGYQDLIHTIENANAWSASSYNWQLQSFIETDQYFAKINKLSAIEKQAALKVIEKTIMNGLALSPLDAFAWYRLALIRKDANRPGQEIVTPLKMSMKAQAMAPTLFIRRIYLFLAYRDSLDKTAYEMLQQQIRLAWQYRPDYLVKCMVDNRQHKQAFKDALIDAPEQFQKLETLVERTHQ